MKTALIILAILIVLFVLLQIVVRRKIKNMPIEKDHQKILTLTAQNFNNSTKSRIVLVDFWASWCAPCRMMIPILNKLADELPDNAFVGKINIEEQQSLANKFKVRSIPTLILFKDGREVKRFVGVKTKDFLIEQIRNI